MPLFASLHLSLPLRMIFFPFLFFFCFLDVFMTLLPSERELHKKADESKVVCLLLSLSLSCFLLRCRQKIHFTRLNAYFKLKLKKLNMQRFTLFLNLVFFPKKWGKNWGMKLKSIDTSNSFHF